MSFTILQLKLCCLEDQMEVIIIFQCYKRSSSVMIQSFATRKKQCSVCLLNATLMRWIQFFFFSVIAIDTWYSPPENSSQKWKLIRTCEVSKSLSTCLPASLFPFCCVVFILFFYFIFPLCCSSHSILSLSLLDVSDSSIRYMWEDET